MVLDDDDRTVRFAHHTVQQFLQSEPKNDQTNKFHFKPAEADSLAGQVCVTYLSFTDFETQVATLKPEGRIEPSDLLGSDIVSVMPKVLGIGKYLFSIPYRLLSGSYENQSPDVNIAKLLRPQPKKPLASTMTEKYRLLDYIVRNWEWHTKFWFQADKLDVDKQMWKLFRNLALHKTLPFDFRAWGSNQHNGPWGCQGCPADKTYPNVNCLPYMTIFKWAVQEGHAPLIMLLCLEPTPRSSVKQGGLAAYCYHESLFVKSAHENCLENNLQHESSLTVACGAGHYEVAALLLIRCYRWKISQIRPIIKAAANGHEKVLRLLLDHSSRKAIEEAGPFALRLAARNGHEGATRALLKYGINCDASNEDKITALHEASRAGHEVVVQTLLSSGANLILKNNLGETALHYATMDGHEKIVLLLLRVVSDPELWESLSCPMSNHAVQGGRDDIIQLPLNEGHETYGAGRSSLQKAVGHSDEPTPKGKNVFIDLGDYRGYSALHLAASHRHVNVVHLLLNGNANINLQSDLGETALHLAVKSGHMEVVRLLLEKGSDTELRCSFGGHTALRLATLKSYSEIATLLLRFGADPEARGHND